MDRPYGFSAYYGRNVKPPKSPGELAITVFWTTRDGRDMEMALAEAREDIGLIVKIDPPEDR